MDSTCIIWLLLNGRGAVENNALAFFSWISLRGNGHYFLGSIVDIQAKTLSSIRGSQVESNEFPSSHKWNLYDTFYLLTYIWIWIHPDEL